MKMSGNVEDSENLDSQQACLSKLKELLRRHSRAVDGINSMLPLLSNASSELDKHLECAKFVKVDKEAAKNIKELTLNVMEVLNMKHSFQAEFDLRSKMLEAEQEIKNNAEALSDRHYAIMKFRKLCQDFSSEYFNYAQIGNKNDDTNCEDVSDNDFKGAAASTPEFVRKVSKSDNLIKEDTLL